MAQWSNRPVSSAVERLSYKEDVAGSNPAPGMVLRQCSAHSWLPFHCAGLAGAKVDLGVLSTHGWRVHCLDCGCPGADAVGSSRIGTAQLCGIPGAKCQLASESHAVAPIQRLANVDGATKPQISLALLHGLLDGSALALIHLLRCGSEDRRWGSAQKSPYQCFGIQRRRL